METLNPTKTVKNIWDSCLVIPKESIRDFSPLITETIRETMQRATLENWPAWSIFGLQSCGYLFSKIVPQCSDKDVENLFHMATHLLWNLLSESLQYPIEPFDDGIKVEFLGVDA